MSATQYLNLDFDFIKSSLKDFLRANSNFTDYDFEGSNLSILLDILSYNTFINSYNTNMVANEAFLNTATIRDNIVAHAENIGYIPRSSRSARAKVSFSTSYPNGSNASFATLKKGSVAVTNLRNSNFPFSVIEDITVPVKNLQASFSEIEIYEGNLITQSFTVNTSQTDQKFILPNTKIDTTTIRVKVKDSATSSIFTEYKLVDNIIGLSSDDPIFIIKEYKNETYELIFGDGLIGKKLVNNNVVEVSYIVCNEDSANGIQNFAFTGSIENNNNTNQPTTGILLNVDQPAIGGSALEPVSSIKKYASRYLASQNRAVTSSDYEVLIPKIFSKAESVVSYGGETLTPPQYGKVFVSVKPDNSSFLSLFDKQFIKEEIKKYSPVGIEVIVQDLSYLFIELKVNAYYSPNLTNSVDNVKSNIFKTLNSFAKSEDLTRFDGRFKYSNFSSNIDDTDNSITSNVTNVVLRRDIYPKLGSNFGYEVCYGNALFCQVGNSFNIQSTGFTVDRFAGTVYLTDIADTVDNGRLALFRIGSDGSPEFLDRNIGTVDYETGELLIDSLNITSTTLSNGIIQIQALPRSNDIIGLRDLFLTISTSNSTVNMIRDDISSGSDSSGVNFTTTPQYNNQGFFRQ